MEAEPCLSWCADGEGLGVAVGTQVSHYFFSLFLFPTASSSLVCPAETSWNRMREHERSGDEGRGDGKADVVCDARQMAVIRFRPPLPSLSPSGPRQQRRPRGGATKTGGEAVEAAPGGGGL